LPVSVAAVFTAVSSLSSFEFFWRGITLYIEGVNVY